jgi:lysophospholipase L1-like esterase
MHLGYVLPLILASHLLGAADAVAPLPPHLRTTTPIIKSKDQEKWLGAHAWLCKEAQRKELKIAFFGDSITHGWMNDNEGIEYWKKGLAPLGAVNFGIGGDRIEHVLWRLQNGELAGMKPEVVVLMVGTNDLWDYDLKPEDYVAGVTACLSTIRKAQPQARILLLGIIPNGEKAKTPMRERILAINALLAKLPPAQTDAFLDFGEKLLTPDGILTKAISRDGTHLTTPGYQIWYDAMMPVLNGLLKK